MPAGAGPDYGSNSAKGAKLRIQKLFLTVL